MLGNMYLEDAYPLMERLAERGLRIIPKDETPLAGLIGAVSGCGVYDLLDQPISEASSLIADVRAASDNAAHNASMSQLINITKASVARTLDHTRTTVVPLINRVDEQVAAILLAKKVSAVMPYTVTQVNAPAIFSNPAILDLIGTRLTAIIDSIPTRAVQTLDIDQVITVTKTGMAGVDAELDTLLGADHNEGYATVQQVLMGARNVMDIESDYVVGVLVAAQALHDNPIGEVAMSLPEYNQYLEALAAVAAKLVNRRKVYYTSLETSGALYVANNSRKMTEILVYGPVYRQMLDNGLTPNILIANEMSSRRFSQGQLIENKETLERVYSREERMSLLRFQNQTSTDTRQALIDVIRVELNKEEWASIRDVGFQRLQGILDVSTPNDYLEQCAPCIDFVCHVFFADTHARTFIRFTEMVEKAVGKEEGSSARETITLATAKYTMWWLRSQLAVCQSH